MILSDAQVRIGSKDGRLEGNEFIHVHTKPVVRIKHQDALLVVMPSAWDPATVTAHDLTQALATEHGVARSMVRLLRRYPQVRAILCPDDHRLYGFAGEVWRIAWRFSAGGG